MLGLRHTPYWYWSHVVWTDICNGVLPTTIRKANAQALSQKAGSGWMSADAKHEVANMRGKKQERVLAGKECTRVIGCRLLRKASCTWNFWGRNFLETM